MNEYLQSILNRDPDTPTPNPPAKADEDKSKEAASPNNIFLIVYTFVDNYR